MDEDFESTPCVGCGYCCRKAPCALAMRIYGNAITKCPALSYRDGRWWCDVVDNARGSLRDEYVKTLAIGAGCCSSLFNQDRENIPAPEPTAPPVDYRKAFQTLCHILSTEMLSGDQLVLMGFRLRAECGEEVIKEYVHWLQEGRAKHIKDFMG